MGFLLTLLLAAYGKNQAMQTRCASRLNQDLQLANLPISKAMSRFLCQTLIDRGKIVFVRLNKIWVNESDPAKKELRLDWSNDRHHAVMIQPPHAPADIAQALLSMAYLIAKDPVLPIETQ
jgi:hypothetical protein